MRIAAALLVAAAASHAVETAKASNGKASPLVLTATRATDDVRTADPATEGAVPRAAALADSGSSGLGELIGITSVAAALPEAADQCSPRLGLAATPGAMIQLSIFAPCNGGERVVVRHSGLSFSARLAADGRALLVVPALRTDALVAVYLEDSRLALGRIDIPEAADYTRLVLVWEPPAEIELRVTDGQKVLIGSNTIPAGPDPWVMALGSDAVRAPVFAGIYSVKGAGDRDASISAELRITPASCGRTLRVDTLLSQNGVIAQEGRPITVPLCGTSGDILVLKNLPPELKLATQN